MHLRQRLWPHGRDNGFLFLELNSFKHCSQFIIFNSGENILGIDINLFTKDKEMIQKKIRKYKESTGENSDVDNKKDFYSIDTSE